MAFYKLDTNSKHSFTAQTTVCSLVAGTKEGRKKPNYSYFLKSDPHLPKKIYGVTAWLTKELQNTYCSISHELKATRQ